MLTLGDKYDLTDIRDDALTVLEAELPDDLAAWDLQYTDSAMRCWGHSEFLFEDEDFISIACTIRDLNVPKLLVRALYMCCTLSLSRLTAGLLGASDQRPNLCHEYLVRCLQGRESLPEVWLNINWKAFERSDDTCAACAPKVDSLRRTTKASAVLDVNNKDKAYDVLNPTLWDDIVNEAAETSGLCAACVAVCRKRVDQLRQEFLNSLEERFM